MTALADSSSPGSIDVRVALLGLAVTALLVLVCFACLGPWLAREPAMVRAKRHEGPEEGRRGADERSRQGR